MTLSFTGRKRLRKFFGKIVEVAQMPNLIEVQKTSYDQFLQVDKPRRRAQDEGLQAVFASVFPIKDFSETSLLEYVDYHFEEPKYDVEECQQRSMTFAAPLKVTLRLIVFDVDQETGAKSVKDIKEQDVYMGDIPFMTENGTFIINGTERVIVSQMHRSAGRVLRPRQGQDAFARQAVCSPRASFPIAARGSISNSTPRTSSMSASTAAASCRRRRCSMRSAWIRKRSSIISTRRSSSSARRTAAGRRRSSPAGCATPRPIPSWKNAKTGEVHRRGRHEDHRAHAAQMAGRGHQDRSLSPTTNCSAAIRALDMVNVETGEIYVEAGDELDRRPNLAQLGEAGFNEIDVINVDGITIGAYIRNTMAVDKNHSREQALIDIYRVMRPGEPPTLDTAETLFGQLFFDSRALRSFVGRPREDEHAPQPRRARHHAHRCARKTSSPSSRRSRICATAAAKSTTSTISAIAACVRWAS